MREKRGVGARLLPVAIPLGHTTWYDAATISIRLTRPVSIRITWEGKPEAYSEPNI